MGDVEKDKKKRDTRRLVLATNLVLAVVVGVVVISTTCLVKPSWLPAWLGGYTPTVIPTEYTQATTIDYAPTRSTDPVSVAHAFLAQRYLVVTASSEMTEDITLPGNFEAVTNKVNIGNLLKQRNELSKQKYGLDFSSYLGQKVTVYKVWAENAGSNSREAVMLISHSNVVGFWYDNEAGSVDPKDTDWQVLCGALRQDRYADLQPDDPETIAIVADLHDKILTNGEYKTGPYPDYFAGAYYADGRLNIMVICDPGVALERIELVVKSMAANGVPFRVLQTEHSYNDLQRQLTAATTILSRQRVNLSDSDWNILARVEEIGFDERNNEVFIVVRGGTGEEIETLNRGLSTLSGYSIVNADIRVDAWEDTHELDQYGNPMDYTSPTESPLPRLTAIAEQEDPGATGMKERPIFNVGTPGTPVIQILLQNDSDTAYTCDGTYSFEKYDEESGTWQAYPFRIGALINLSTKPIPAHETSYRPVSLMELRTTPEPGIYRVWVVDNHYTCEFELVDPAAMPSSSDIFHGFLDQQNIKMPPSMTGGSSIANMDIQLPDDFNAVVDGMNIGELLMQRNELSKLGGLDFSAYMGQKATLYTAEPETGSIVVLIADGRVVGFWHDPGQGDPDMRDFYVLGKLHTGWVKKIGD